MAFCTKCGAVMNPHAKFCPTCGAEAPAIAQAAAAAAAPAAASMPPAPSPAPSVPAPVATGSSSSALKIVLIVVAVVVALGIITMGIIGYGAYKLRQRVHEGNEGTVSLSGMSIKGNRASPDILRELGVEPYPNARMLPGGAVVHLGEGVAGGAEFETSDTPSQVASYYRFHYPHSTLTSDQENTSTLVIDQGSRGILAMSMKRDGDRTHVSVSRIGSPAK